MRSVQSTAAKVYVLARNAGHKLTCAGDAKKPSCANCEARGVECKYPALKFVLNEGKTGNGTPQQYQRVQVSRAIVVYCL